MPVVNWGTNDCICESVATQPIRVLTTEMTPF